MPSPSIRDAVVASLAKASITLPSVGLDILLIDHNLNGDDTYSGSSKAAVQTAVLGELETLLAKPDVQEGDLSIRYDRAAIRAYCAQLRTELGLPSDNDGPVIRDASNVW